MAVSRSHTNGSGKQGHSSHSHINGDTSMTNGSRHNSNNNSNNNGNNNSSMNHNSNNTSNTNNNDNNTNNNNDNNNNNNSSNNNSTNNSNNNNNNNNNSQQSQHNNKNSSEQKESVATIEKLDSNETRAALDSLFSKLLKNNCLVDVREGLQTFLIYVSNIIRHPNEAKYRKIRIGNVNYQVRLGHLVGGQELLEFLGYVEDDKGFLVLPLTLHRRSDGLQQIKLIRDLACAKLENVTKKFKEVPRLANSHTWNAVVHAAEAHSIGRRTSMEDDHLLIDNFQNGSDCAFFALYDGHGGRSSVDFLTCSLYLNLEFYLKKNNNIAMKKVFEDVYELTDKQIHRQQIYQSGSTSVTCLIRNEGKKRMLHIANCGDSRAVLCRNGKAIRLTKDHKADDPDEEAMIKKRGGVIGRMKRVNGLLAVTRAFGDHLLKPPISVKPHYKSLELTDKDEFLVIACDGVWDVMKDEEVTSYIYQSVTRKAKAKSWKLVDSQTLRHVLHTVCLEIIKLSIDRRSQDNVSVIIAAL